MENILLLKSFITLVCMGCFLYIVLKLLKKYGKFDFSKKFKEDAINIRSIQYIDHQTKIVNFLCEQHTYIVLLGKNNDILIDKYKSPCVYDEKPTE